MKFLYAGTVQFLGTYSSLTFFGFALDNGISFQVGADLPDVAAVPETGTLSLLLAGLLGVHFARRWGARSEARPA